jgi:hypothetical protein
MKNYMKVENLDKMQDKVQENTPKKRNKSMLIMKKTISMRRLVFFN